MRIVICSTCWSWVMLRHESCPECGLGLDWHRPDPSDESLRQRFGTWLAQLGVVHVDATRLPSLGTLSLTSTGLLFLPYLAQGRNGAVFAMTEHDRRDGPRRPFWSLWRARQPVRRTAGPSPLPTTVWMPGLDGTPTAALSNPAAKRPLSAGLDHPPPDPTEPISNDLSRDPAAALPSPALPEVDLVARFLDCPGAWFTSAEDLCRLQLRSQRLLLERRVARSLKLTLRSEPALLRHHWGHVIKHAAAWQHLQGPSGLDLA
jgi:hypothetical protein